jgi:eukaryotic-like serine/threonine-protein kinase
MTQPRPTRRFRLGRPSGDRLTRDGPPRAAPSERLCRSPSASAGRSLTNAGLLRSLLSGRSYAIPSDLERESVRRLRILCTTLLFVGLFIAALGFGLGIPAQRIKAPLDAGVLTLVLFSTVAFIIALRSVRLAPRSLLRLGGGYQLFLAYSVAFLANGVSWPGALRAGWPPTAVIAFLFAILVPMAPMKALFQSSLTVAMDPLAKLTLLAMGYSELSRTAWIVGVLPGLGAIVLAVVASQVIYGLGVSLGEAREMGSYVLTRRLGQGGMGEVWEAQHRLLVRRAAIKFIRRPETVGAHAGADVEKKRQTQFEHEAHATATLRSPHSISVYDYGIARDGTFFYVMELLNGVDLETLVHRHGPQPPSRVVNILLQVCLSLEDAHERGLIHRDVKPGNIFLARLGPHVDFVKVLDFGLAAWADEARADVERQQGRQGMVGTPAFVAPEQAMGLEVDGRADLYSLGCVGYWLLTGRLVFEAPTAVEVVARHLLKEPPPMESPSVPLSLQAVVLRCLAKAPDQRFASARAMRTALLELDVPPWTDDDAQAWWSEQTKTRRAHTSGEAVLTDRRQALDFASECSLSNRSEP